MEKSTSSKKGLSLKSFGEAIPFMPIIGGLIWQVLEIIYSPNIQPYKVSDFFGLITFGAGCMWEIIKDRLKISGFENAKPTVKISPNLDGKLAFLTVQNKGKSKAEFSVLINAWGGGNSKTVTLLC